jgi:hypothetical protein
MRASPSVGQCGLRAVRACGGVGSAQRHTGAKSASPPSSRFLGEARRCGSGRARTATTQFASKAFSVRAESSHGGLSVPDLAAARAVRTSRDVAQQSLWLPAPWEEGTPLARRPCPSLRAVACASGPVLGTSSTQSESASGGCAPATRETTRDAVVAAMLKDINDGHDTLESLLKLKAGITCDPLRRHLQDRSGGFRSVAQNWPSSRLARSRRMSGSEA